MENLNIHGDNTSSSQKPTLTQAELSNLCLVGRVLVNKPVHLATLESRLGPIWEPKYQMTLIPMEDNKFMVQLYSQADLNRILDRSPWILDNNMIILQKVAIGENPMTLPMTTTEIWVQVHQLPFGFMDDKVGALVGSHIGTMIKFDEENNYGPWRRFMRIRVAIAIEAPLQQELIIEREEGDDIKLLFKYEKLGKFCFVCGIIGHSENFCSEKFESGSAGRVKKWGAYLRAENNTVGGGQKEVNRWITGGRNKGSGGQMEGGATINDHHGHSMVIDGNKVSNHKVFGRIKVRIDPELRTLTFFKYMECQRSNETGLVRWWTEINPLEINVDGPNHKEANNNKKTFVPNLTKSDQVNRVLAEGMTEEDEFLYANGGGAEALWKLFELKAQNKGSPQHSIAGGSKAAARVVTVCKHKQVADSRGPPVGNQQQAHANQGLLALSGAGQQQVVPYGQQSSQQSFQHSLAVEKMSAHAYRKLFSTDPAPINVSLKTNNDAFQGQMVDNMLQIRPTTNIQQSSILSPVFNAVDNRAELASNKDNSSQLSRARSARKDKAVAVSQSHGKPRKPAVVRMPAQPGSFMAAARGASKVIGPHDEVGSKKRSRTENTEENVHEKEGHKAMTVVNNPVFEKKEETAGPGHQACRDQ